MNATLRRRLEMAARVRDFLRAHRTDGVAEGAALARLEQLVDRAEELAAQQRAGVVARQASTAHRAKVRRELQSQLLRYLSAVATVAGKENAELATQFRLPRTQATNQAFVTLCQGMLEKATEQKALLVSKGLSETLLDDLTASLKEFEQTLETTRAGRRDHVGASGDLRAVLSEISQQVRLLDGLVRYRFGDNAELMSAWASVRNVVGPFKPHMSEQVGGGETPGAVAPAA
jgi:hypothetical protein